MLIELKLLRPGSKIPVQTTVGAAAFDLYACLGEPLIIPPWQTMAIPTGVAIFINDRAYVLFVWERSGLGKLGVQVRGGVVDSDYQGEIFVMLTNGNDIPFEVQHGNRVAQAVIQPVVKPAFTIVNEFSRITERGEKRFGSSGR